MPPSEFVCGGVDFRVSLVVLERERSRGHIEHEGAEGPVVVLPAAMEVVEIVPGDRLDSASKLY